MMTKINSLLPISQSVDSFTAATSQKDLAGVDLEGIEYPPDIPLSVAVAFRVKVVASSWFAFLVA